MLSCAWGSNRTARASDFQSSGSACQLRRLAQHHVTAGSARTSAEEPIYLSDAVQTSPMQRSGRSDLASAFRFCFQRVWALSRVLHRPIETTAVTGHL